MKLHFKTILKALNPDPMVGGLEISEGAVRYVVLAGDKSVVRSAVEPLGPDVVHNGRVASETALRAALRALHVKVARENERVPVIGVVSPVPVYVQVFSMPPLPPERVEEAARLNLRMISPIDFEGAYADWQNISETEALGAFIDQKIADEYRGAAEAAGFIVAALEFAPLALARVVAAAGDLEKEEPYAVVSMGGEGITFIIVREGSLYFTRFIEWSAIGEAPVPVNHFQEVVGLEIKRLLHFYTSKWGGIIQKAFVVNSTSNKELAEWIKKEFSLEVFALGGYHTMDRTWLTVVGAALRGLTPRAEDRCISLARVGTEDLVVQNRVWRFMALWRTVVYAVLGVSVAGFVVADVALVRVERGVRAEAQVTVGREAQGNAASLEAQAKAFNALVEKALRAQSEARPWAAMVKAVFDDAKKLETKIMSIQLDAAQKKVLVSGIAPHEQGVIAFKNALADNPGIALIDLPLSAITQATGGKAAFSATIIIK